jgi:hypothetical protein
MAKKILVLILATVLLLAVLFVPIPKSPGRDGGTREYSALTYKIVDWNRLTTDGVYDATKFYWFPNNFKSIDELWTYEEQEVIHKFVATVIEINGNSVTVEPVIGEDELQSSDRISVNTASLGDIGAEIGSDVEIYYTGGIMESYPAQINATKWTLADNLRHREYTGEWLDKETAKGPDYAPVSDIIITRIYSNCFFARAVIPMPYEIKVNGQLSEEWCVGDQVSCTYENTYYDDQNGKIETDLLSIAPSDFELDPNACYKPVIYLYPEKQTEVSVKLQLDGKLTCTYPAYNTGWTVTAAPDGTLTDAKGQIYNYLYWEGETNAQWDLSQGFCVKGEDTAAFLEDALAKLGLNRKEANEFIVYWLPLMEQNPYNIISFQTDIYTDAAQLQITPTPDTLIRVFMAWRAADAFTELEEQELIAPERTGFTVVEWGGTQLP